MDLTTRNRAELKSYFVKNSIPTERNFAELIDGMLNQRDDGLIKLPGNPLSIEAAGANASEKKALSIYQNLSDQNPAWTLSLNPRSNPNDSNSGKLGFNIGDGDGRSRLFIDRNAGNVGIGTVEPQGRLHIAEATGTQHSATSGSLVIDHENSGGASSIIFRSKVNRGSDYGFIQFQDAATVGGTGESARLVIGINNDAEDHVILQPSGNVGIGTTNPGAKLDVNGTLQVVCGGTGTWNKLVVTPTGEWGDSNTTFVTIGAGGAAGIMLSNPHVTWRDSRASIRYGRSGGVQAGAFWDVGVRGDNAFSFALNGDDHKVWLAGNGNVGIGAADPKAKLDITASAQTWGGWYEAIRFSQSAHSAITHPGGNLLFGLHSDRRFYFADTSEGQYIMTIDANPAGGGNVGIGTTTPAAKLDVLGTVQISNGSSYAVKNNFMASGSLTIGSITANYGGGRSWNTNTAGLLLETSANTEIAVHDSGTRVASLMYYEGEGSNQITIGRDMGWGAISNIILRGNITTGKALLAMGTTDGSQAAANEVVGGMGFYGFGRQHGLLSFRVGSGFEMIDCSRDAPNLNYARDSYPYADLKVRNLAQTSSKESKENIADLSAQEAFEALAGLNAVKFSYLNDAEKHIHAGFIAEDSPDIVVSPDGKGIQSMDIVAILTRVVKEQQKIISALERKVETLAG